ncbi:MAG: DNA topoisomerase [Candidatus Nitrosotenuis sp.]
MRKQEKAVLVVKPIKKIKKLGKIRLTKSKIAKLQTEMRQYYDVNSFLSWSASKKKYIVLGSNEPKNGLVACPSCKVGKLMIIRSRKTKKRFMGCSNYYNGCKASSPMLQKAMIYATKSPCAECQWPMIFYRYSRKQKWLKQCANFNCPIRKPRD